MAKRDFGGIPTMPKYVTPLRLRPDPPPPLPFLRIQPHDFAQVWELAAYFPNIPKGAYLSDLRSGWGEGGPQKAAKRNEAE